MLKYSRQLQRLMFLAAVAGLFAVSADLACLAKVCAEDSSGAYRTRADIDQERIRTFNEALAQTGTSLTPEQQNTLTRDGQLFGVVKLDRPVKHPNGAIEMPANWLATIPEGHPWAKSLTPADDAYYSFVEERIFRAELFDPANPAHQQAAAAYLAKGEKGESFIGWTTESRTECEKIKLDARGSGGEVDAE
jgi:hypothetical protein